MHDAPIDRLRALPLRAVVTALAVMGCAGGDERARSEPPSSPFVIELHTSEGAVRIEFVPEWSPLAVARARALAEAGYWEGGRIYRVNDRYVQFGYSGRPKLDSAWISSGVPDEPTRASNLRGTVSFARGGPGTRSAILFINRTDNPDLDALAWNGVVGFPPVGRVISGMDVLDRLHDAYGDEPLQWEDSIAALGNAFLDRVYPGLDSILDVELVPEPQ